ncbi:RNA polymerase sigma factor [Thalassotalea sp. 1_MG-2023]|uniref:RNA polymerase sigma factor n=1 Tax=Thalassotalea sp. 1_MG-2023 TaxID=3062680 RepID=UPI0034A27926
MKQGDEKAFEECYQYWSSHIYTAICKICNVQETADDIMQVTFVSAFENILSYTPTFTFIAWLKRIAFNKPNLKPTES